MSFRINKPISKLRRDSKISQASIRDTISSPDAATNLDLNAVQRELMGYAEGDNVILSFYLKKHSHLKRDYYLLIGIRREKDGTLTVTDAYKLNDELIAGLDEISPIVALEILCKRFGLRMSIGGKVSNFFYREILPTPPGSLSRPLTPTLLIQPRNCHHCTWGKIDARSGQTFIALAYGIDHDRYLRWLKQARI